MEFTNQCCLSSRPTCILLSLSNIGPNFISILDIIITLSTMYLVTLVYPRGELLVINKCIYCSIWFNEVFSTQLYIKNVIHHFNGWHTNWTFVLKQHIWIFILHFWQLIHCTSTEEATSCCMCWRVTGSTNVPSGATSSHNLVSRCLTHIPPLHL